MFLNQNSNMTSVIKLFSIKFLSLRIKKNNNYSNGKQSNGKQFGQNMIQRRCGSISFQRYKTRFTNERRFLKKIKVFYDNKYKVSFSKRELSKSLTSNVGKSLRFL